jgi:hypothetical protein
MVFGTAGEHQTPRVDRKIRFIKDSMRSMLNSLPYKLPKSLLQYAVMFAVSRANLVRHSATHELHQLSPKELFTGVKSDYKRDLRVAFGDYCEVRAPYSNNSMNEKTSSGIALLPTGNANGFMLKSKRVVIRDKFVVLPNIPDTIVVQMNYIARGEMQGSNIISSDDKDDNNSSATSAPSHEIPTIHDEADRVAAADDLPLIDSATAEAPSR